MLDGREGELPSVFNSRGKRDYFYLPFRALAMLSVSPQGWRVTVFEKEIKTTREGYVKNEESLG